MEAAALVCSANSNIRFGCDALCKRCRHLIPDRRRQRAGAYRPRFQERRYYHDPAPNLLQLAGDAVAMPRAAVLPRVSAALPLLLALALVVFNLLDALLTWRALSLGAVEANPLMSGIFNQGPAVAILMKSVLVAAGAVFLWRCWRLPLARHGMMAVTACYGAVVAYHLIFQFVIL